VSAADEILNSPMPPPGTQRQRTIMDWAYRTAKGDRTETVKKFRQQLRVRGDLIADEDIGPLYDWCRKSHGG
jgi:hypothetical protein